MNNSKGQALYKVMMVVAVATMAVFSYLRYRHHQEDDQMQQRMQEGMESKRVMDEANATLENWDKSKRDFDKQFQQQQTSQAQPAER